MDISKSLKVLMGAQSLSTMELARRTGIGQPVIYRIISGETNNPKVATLCAIADYFNVTVNQLIGETPLPQKKKAKAQTSQDTVCQIPLLTWQEATRWPNIPKKTKQDHIVYTDLSYKSSIYSLIIQDDSMYPLFPKGTTLIIDTSKEPTDRSYAIVRPRGAKEVLFRQVLKDDIHQYLKPLNPDTEQFKMRLFAKGDKYVGTLVQAKMNYS